MTLLEYSLLAFSSLFVMVDPIAAVPAFIAMTPEDPPATQLRMARLACVVAALILIGFVLGGKYLFRMLGITLPAFQIAGSLLLLRIALDMLHGKRSASQETDEETDAGAAKHDIAITPLAVPMLAGPGAISAALILLNQAENAAHKAALYGVIAVVFLLSYWIFHLAVVGAKRLSPLALKLVTRLMGLLLAAIGVQFVLDGLKQAGLFK
jgi:multiple antibiotic resistance protein